MMKMILRAALAVSVWLGGYAHAQRLITAGDSTVFGLGLTAPQMFANRLAGDLHLPLVNRAVNGNQVGDLSMDSLVFQPLATDTEVIQVVNDQRIYGINAALQEVAVEALRDVIVKATAPVRVLPQAMMLTGTWAVTGAPFWGEYTDGISTATAPSVCGSTVWVSYVATQWVNGHSQATVMIDGALVDTIHSDAGGAALETQNNVAGHTSTMWFPATKAYTGLSSGCHTVQLSTIISGQRFYSEGITGSAQQPGARVYLNKIPPIGAACTPAPCGTPANLASYNASWAALVAEMTAAGRLVVLVDAGLSLATDYQTDQLHPNAGGNVKEEVADYQAITGQPFLSVAAIQVDPSGNFYGVRGSSIVQLQAAP